MKIKLSQKKLRGELIGFITAKKTNYPCKAAAFKGYIKKAFPDLKILAVRSIKTTAALNSLSVYIDIMQKNERRISAFAKIHIESNSQSTSTLGVENEYAQANLLVEHGWPVIIPIMVSHSKDYPLLIYPRSKAKTLFDLFKNSYDKGRNLITNDDLAILFRLNKQVGKSMVNSIKIVNSQEAVTAPVQTLLLDRFKKGGRIDQWYKPNIRFRLTKKDRQITWQKLLTSGWVINGISYNVTLREIIKNARKCLSFAQESKAVVCVSHGDDHSGNIFIDRKKKKAFMFDPAFAGWNPTILSNVKTLAHSCFLPMGGMYYNPKIRNISYRWNESKNVIYVDIPFKFSTLYSTHEALAKQIIDLRILPLIQKYKPAKANMKNEFERIKYALAGCALLTTNIPKLLKQNDGRGQGLLPLTIMFAELKGLPMLDYLRKKIVQTL